MCTQAEADKIRKEAGLWMQRGKPFTSVDIANSLKQRGDWIKNREVAAYLRQNALSFASQYTQGRFNYTQSTITVTLSDGSQTQAQLYHPDTIDPIHYKSRSQRALSPDEALGDNPTDAQRKNSIPFAGLASSDGIFALPEDRYREEHEQNENKPTFGISGATFRPRPYQEIHIHVGSVENLVISSGDFEIEQEED